MCLNMGYSISQTLIPGHPPLLVFTVCLAAFGLTMIILAYVVGEEDLPNPDVQIDWNNLFTKISDLKLCPLEKDSNGKSHGRNVHKTLSNTNSVLNSSSHVVDESKSMSAVLSNVVHYASDEKYDSLEFTDIFADVQFKLVGKSHPSSFFQVSGKIKGSLLGFTGKYSSLLFNISLNFLSSRNFSCMGENCNSLWDVCLTISVPSDLLFEAKLPDRCDIQVVSSPDAFPVFFVSAEDSSHSDSSCISLDYTPNSKLTEMLSLHDRSIVNLHLMHTSYFMFVMVMTLICYSLIRGRHPKNSQSFEKIPLDA